MYKTSKKPTTPWGKRLLELMKRDQISNPTGLYHKAKAMGIEFHQPTIHRILYINKKPPGNATIEKIKAIFNVTTDQALGNVPLDGKAIEPPRGTYKVDKGLAEVIDSWPHLSKRIRAAIQAIATTCGTLQTEQRTREEPPVRSLPDKQG